MITVTDVRPCYRFHGGSHEHMWLSGVRGTGTPIPVKQGRTGLSQEHGFTIPWLSSGLGLNFLCVQYFSFWMCKSKKRDSNDSSILCRSKKGNDQGISMMCPCCYNDYLSDNVDQFHPFCFEWEGGHRTVSGDGGEWKKWTWPNIMYSYFVDSRHVDLC
jgi:hypothetical protein